jgi:hypothetical protein
MCLPSNLTLPPDHKLKVAPAASAAAVAPAASAAAAAGQPQDSIQDEFFFEQGMFVPGQAWIPKVKAQAKTEGVTNEQAWVNMARVLGYRLPELRQLKDLEASKVPWVMQIATLAHSRGLDVVHLISHWAIEKELSPRDYIALEQLAANPPPWVHILAKGGNVLLALFSAAKELSGTKDSNLGICELLHKKAHTPTAYADPPLQNELDQQDDGYLGDDGDDHLELCQQIYGPVGPDEGPNHYSKNPCWLVKYVDDCQAKDLTLLEFVHNYSTSIGITEMELFKMLEVEADNFQWFRNVDKECKKEKKEPFVIIKMMAGKVGLTISDYLKLRQLHVA